MKSLRVMNNGKHIYIFSVLMMTRVLQLCNSLIKSASPLYKHHLFLLILWTVNISKWTVNKKKYFNTSFVDSNKNVCIYVLAIYWTIQSQKLMLIEPCWKIEDLISYISIMFFVKCSKELMILLMLTVKFKIILYMYLIKIFN